MPVIKAAKKRGLHVLVADDRPNAPGLQLADKLISIYRYNPLALFRTCKEQQVDAVVSAGADKSVWIASAICNILKLPCSVTPRAAKLPLRKSRMRKMLRDFQIPCPRHTRVLAGDEPDIDGFEFPLVVKPEDGIAQAGVAKVENLAALHDAIAGAIACSESGVTVIEEFVEGIELDINGLVNPTGRATLLSVGYRRSSREPDRAFGVAVQKSVPAELTDAQWADLEGILNRSAALFELKSGPLYAQVMKKPDGSFSVIEVMPRLGGGEDPRLVAIVNGTDMNDALIATALGLDSDPANFRNDPLSPAATALFIVGHQGIFDGVDGFPLDDPCVVYQTLYVVPGESIASFSSSREKIGIVIIAGKTISATDSIAKDIVCRLSVRTRPIV